MRVFTPSVQASLDAGNVVSRDMIKLELGGGTYGFWTLPPFKLSIRPITSAFGHTPQSIFEYVAVLV